jgi:hypothetical protein
LLYFQACKRRGEIGLRTSVLERGANGDDVAQHVERLLG